MGDVQMDVAQLRAIVAAPLQHRRLFLVAGAMHIVPPTEPRD